MGKALMTIQRAFGVIPRIIGKGDSAKVRHPSLHSRFRQLTLGPLSQRLTDLLHRLRRELPLATPSSTPLANGTIDSMIVLDRQVDMVTPMCTQLTYEGLVDEVIGIRNCERDAEHSWQLQLTGHHFRAQPTSTSTPTSSTPPQPPQPQLPQPPPSAPRPKRRSTSSPRPTRSSPSCATRTLPWWAPS